MKDFIQKNKKVIYSSIFNVIEILAIILLGLIMKVKIEEIIILMLMFFIARITCYKPMHYKSPILCFIWSTLVFASFFLLTKINLTIAILMTAFEAIIATKVGDIKDCTMYRNKEEDGKYRELKQYVENNKNTKELDEFENELKKFSNKYNDRYKINLYEVYILIFYENDTYDTVKKKLGLRNDNHIITSALDMVFICYNTYIDVKEQYKQKKEKLANF